MKGKLLFIIPTQFYYIEYPNKIEISTKTNTLETIGIYTDILIFYFILF